MLTFSFLPSNRNVSLNHIMILGLPYKDFLYLHVLRELSPKYRILWVGVFWTLGQPLLSSLAVASFVGPRLVERLVTQQYFFYCWTGFSIWFFFSQSIQASCSSLNQKMKLVRSSCVPKEYLVLSPVFAGLFELLLSFLFILAIAIPVWGPSLTLKTPFLVISAFFITALFSLGIAFWVSALGLLFQDFRYLLSFLIQMGFLCSPIIYSPRISGIKASLYYSNPLALSMKLVRQGLGISQAVEYGEIWGCFLILFVTFSAGLFFFRSQSKLFPEIV